MLMVERKSRGPMETNIDSHLQEEESTTRLIKESIEI